MFLRSWLRKAPAVDRICIVRPYYDEPALECNLVGLFENHWNSGVGQHHRNSAAHGPCAHHRRGFYGDHWGLFRHVVNLGGFSLAKKNMNERFRLVREEALKKKLLLCHAAFFERHFRGRFHCIDGGNRSPDATLPFGNSFTGGRDDQSILRRASKLLLAMSRFAFRVIGNLPRKRDRSSE